MAELDLLRHRFGVNYVPSRNWYYSWNDFEPEAFARDLDAVAGIGADHIRLQTIWPWFQPNPASVSEAHLARLRTVVELAGERGLDVWVTAFTGWLSGFNFTPPYQKPDLFYWSESDGFQERYLASLINAVGDLPAFAGIDLGNEICCAWQTPDLATGDAWGARRLGLCGRLHPQGVHVNGVDHQPWFGPQSFSPKGLCDSSAIATLHCWTYFTGALNRGRPLDPPAVGLLSGMAALARSWAGDGQKPVWVQEFGASREWMDEPTISRSLTETVHHAVRGGVSWFTWWCSHDIDKAFRFDDLEYPLGLLDLDNKPKPEALVFRDLANEFRGKPVTLPAAPPSPPEHTPDRTWDWLLQVIESQAKN